MAYEGSIVRGEADLVGPAECVRVAHDVASRRRPFAAGCWMFEVQRSTKEGDVRVSTALNRMLGLPGAWVRDVEFGERAVIVTVVLKAKKPACSGCGARGLKIKEQRTKPWRHLDLGGLRCVMSAGSDGCIAPVAARCTSRCRGRGRALGTPAISRISRRGWRSR